MLIIWWARHRQRQNTVILRAGVAVGHLLQAPQPLAPLLEAPVMAHAQEPAFPVAAVLAALDAPHELLRPRPVYPVALPVRLTKHNTCVRKTQAKLLQDDRAHRYAIQHPTKRDQAPIATTYPAVDTHAQPPTQVAITVVNTDSREHAELLERAQASERVVRLLDHWVHGGRLHIVTRLVPHSSLDAWLLRMVASGRYSVRSVVVLMRDIAQGLADLQLMGILHRAIRPANIRVDVREGIARCVLADFVDARAIEHQLIMMPPDDSYHDEMLLYMAPERILVRCLNY